MSSTDFKLLLSPLVVGRHEIRNRVLSTAHGTGFGLDGTVNDRHIAYHAERARGGIGLIVMEATSVDGASLGGTTSSRTIDASTDTVIPGYRRIADAVHAEGAKIFTLLSHSGPE